MKANGKYAVVQTHSNATNQVVKQLRRQQFEYYHPQYSERVVSRGSVSFRRVPLFQNYLFVLVKDRWRALMSTRGVARLLMAAPERPAFMSKRWLQLLKACENELGLVDINKFDKTFDAEFRKLKFRQGQKVQVKSLGLASAIYQSQPAAGRALVLLSLLGGERTATVSEGDLIAA